MKYFQVAFFILFMSGLMILSARLGLRGQLWFVDDTHFLKLGLVGVCVFCVGYGFLLAGILFGGKDRCKRD